MHFAPPIRSSPSRAFANLDERRILKPMWKLRVRRDEEMKDAVNGNRPSVLDKGQPWAGSCALGFTSLACIVVV